MSSFIDESQLHAKGGNGGAGIVSFRREAHVDKGGPDGGDGGSGGDVWLEANHNVASLVGFNDHPFRRAEDGTHGKGKKKHGSKGSDLVVLVPEGTVVKTLSGDLVADLSNPGDRFLAAEGGRGGKGNARFLSNRRRAPAFAEQGEVGEEHWFNLELKLMADVALIGFPNAGKSTLISTISASKAKVADYPFTTLVPNLGVVRIKRDSSPTGEVEIVIADIPGLVEGASEGRGLGHQFLRHIERARVLVVLLDLASAEGVSPADQLSILLKELGDYKPELLGRPRVVIGSKCDALGLGASDDPPEGCDMIISSVARIGLDGLIATMADLVESSRAKSTTVRKAPVIHRLEPAGVKVTREGPGLFTVEGKQAERAVALNDLNAPGAAQYVANLLKKIGVEKELIRAGVREGDVVQVGSFSFVYEAD